MTILEALKTLLPELTSGPFIDSIRARACECDSDWHGSSWDHPRVRRCIEAIKVLEKALEA